jgi:hypothetical protein
VHNRSHLDTVAEIEVVPITREHAAAVGRGLINTVISCVCDEASKRLDGAVAFESCIVFLSERLD